jgi:hypothetical protein
VTDEGLLELARIQRAAWLRVRQRDHELNKGEAWLGIEDALAEENTLVAPPPQTVDAR